MKEIQLARAIVESLGLNERHKAVDFAARRQC